MLVKVKGAFEVHDFGIILVVPLDKKNFDSLKEHVNYSMFFSYKRLASAFKRIALISIGDHLDQKGQQNYSKADVCIDVRILTKLTPSQLDILEKGNAWHIHAISDKESYLFSIDKDTQFITSRVYYSDRNNVG